MAATADTGGQIARGQFVLGQLARRATCPLAIEIEDGLAICASCHNDSTTRNRGSPTIIMGSRTCLVETSRRIIG